MPLKRILALVLAGLVCASTSWAKKPQPQPPLQPLTDEAAIAALGAGQFEPLKDWQKLSEAGDPVAMFWWGSMLEACAVDRCRAEEGARWRMKAAQKGHARARISVFSDATNATQMTALTQKLGPPQSNEERTKRALFTLAKLDTPKATADAAMKSLDEAIQQEPTLLALVGASGLLRLKTPLLRAIVEAGGPVSWMTSESLYRRLMKDERKFYAELLAQAQQGDKAVGISLCEASGVMAGLTVLPDTLLPICVRAANEGQLGLVPVLLTHHVLSKNMEQAARYAKLCEVLPLSCADSLSDYHRAVLGETQESFERQAVALIANGSSASELTADSGRELPLEVIRKGVARRTVINEAKRVCMLRKHQEATNTFEAVEGCPWGQPLPDGLRIE